MPLTRNAGVSPNTLPLDQWLDVVATRFLGTGTDRDQLVAEMLLELAADARTCTTPGVPLSVADFLDRLPCVRAERDGAPMPPRGSWVDHARYVVTH